MKSKLFAIGMALLGYLNVAHSQTLITNVLAAPLWTDTGISLTNGEWVSVNAAGEWYWNGPNVTNDPDGVFSSDASDIWIDTGTHGSLIAFIGADPYQGSHFEGGVFQTNQYSEIGTACQFASATNGELWLGINDDAHSGSTNDNAWSVVATVSLGFSNNVCYSNMTLSVATVSSNSFSFYISNGIPRTVCSIYDSSDLTHWTLLDSLALDANGSSRNGTDFRPPSQAGLTTNGAFVNVTAVPYRFYKVSNGQFWSQAIGFERITVGPASALSTNDAGANAFIANQWKRPIIRSMVC